MEQNKISGRAFKKIKSLFKATIKDHLFLFSYKGLPKDIHFTLSFNGEYCDFHVTKENGTLDNKPRITIAKIKRTEAQEALQLLSQHLMSQFLRPLNDQNIGRAYRGAWFISLDKLEKLSSGTDWLKKCEDIISEMLLSKKGDLKVPESAEHLLNVLNDQSIPIVPGMKLHRKSYISSTTNIGLITHGNEGIMVIRINKKWYQFLSPGRNRDVLANFLKPGLRRKLILNIYKAITLVNAADTVADTVGYKKLAIELKIIR
jgi:hypothetical protein